MPRTPARSDPVTRVRASAPLASAPPDTVARAVRLLEDEGVSSPVRAVFSALFRDLGRGCPEIDAVLAALAPGAEPAARDMLGGGAAVPDLGPLYEQVLERLAGDTRRASGRFYTPPPLVEALLDRALEPAVREALASPTPEASLQAITLVDPACGAGHFLLAALRRLAGHLARLRHGSIPSAEALRRAAVDVVPCLHGVDLDANAVEICRFVLWLEAADPDLAPVLATRIRTGNALVGTTPTLISAGVPDTAYEPAPGDDRAVARALARRNTAERATPPSATNATTADAWCAAFFAPKRSGMAVPTTATLDTLRPPESFFHWHLAFPDVHARGGFDVVVGNPPFLNQLESATAVGDATRRLLGARFGGARAAYTDVATLFLLLAHEQLRPGGRQALVQPLSMFAAADAGPTRARLAAGAAIEDVWITTDRMFASALVFVGAVTLRKGGDRHPTVSRASGNTFAPADPLTVDMDTLATAPTWGGLIADLAGVPRVHLDGKRTLRDLAASTADFRDQFYGLAPFVVEDAGQPDATHPPLVVTGLVDAAACRWGERPCRFAKVAWRRPRVDLAALEAGGDLGPWARARLAPKLVVATQTKVIEAFADPTGRVLNTVPTITVTPRHTEDLWRLLAVLLAPPVSAWALGRYVGAALTVDALKLSASQVGEIPLPPDTVAWEEGAAHARAASEGANRLGALEACAEAMCRAYGVAAEPLLRWWRGRLE